MPRTRLSMLQEGQLWDIALEHFGIEELLQIVVDRWSTLEPPSRPTVDHLCAPAFSQNGLNLMRIAKNQVGVSAPDRETVPETVFMYSRHASDLAEGLLALLPKAVLPQDLKGIRLEDELGI